MYTIKRFANLEAMQPIWQRLEQNSFHYPFQSWHYLKLFSDHFCKESDLILVGIEDNNTTLALAAFERIGQHVLWLGMKPVLGKEEITDFGDLLYSPDSIKKANVIQAIWRLLFSYLRTLGINQMQLDYLRWDSPSMTYLQTQAHEQATQETSPFILLQNTWDEYLTLLSRVDRKELKRKLKRLDSQKPEYELCQTITSTDMADFIKLHRLSDPAKNQFMSAPMARFFQDLVKKPLGMWQSQLYFLNIANQRVAAVLLFINSSHILLYNSGYHPSFAYYSVGLLLKARLIQIAIESRLQVFDFLRGNERYKYDLGARDLVLKQLRINL